MSIAVCLARGNPQNTKGCLSDRISLLLLKHLCCCYDNGGFFIFLSGIGLNVVFDFVCDLCVVGSYWWVLGGFWLKACESVIIVWGKY